VDEDLNIVQPPRRRDPQSLLPVINGVLASVGILYMATESIAVTVIGAVVAIALVALYQLSRQ
jgi:hypothetical protein